MQIGRKIYYGKSNGVIIWDKGQMNGDVVETTMEQDMEVMPVLKMIPPEELGICQLQFDEFKEEFSTCIAFKINPESGTPEFMFNAL